jgi:RES domain-containing protein
VVDISAGFDPQLWSSEWREWDCDWRDAWIIRQEPPPSWHAADAAIAAGAQGILFPSIAARGGTNLVVYEGALSVAGNVVAHDPDSRLPRDPRSWEPTSSTDR